MTKKKASDEEEEAAEVDETTVDSEAPPAEDKPRGAGTGPNGSAP